MNKSARRPILTAVFAIVVSVRAGANSTRCEQVFQSPISSAQVLMDLARLRLRLESLQGPDQKNLRSATAADFRAKRAEAVVAGLSLANLDLLVAEERLRQSGADDQNQDRIEKIRERENSLAPWITKLQVETPKTEGSNFFLDPAGQTAIGVSNTGQFWTVDFTETQPAVQLNPQTLPFRSGRLGKDGKQFVLLNSQGEIFIWDLALKKVVQHLQTRYFAHSMTGLLPDGKSLLLNSAGKKNEIVSLSTGRQIRKLEDSAVQLADSLLNPNGKTLLRFVFDTKTLELWDTSTGLIIQTLDDPPILPSSIQFSSEGRYFAGLPREKSISLVVWDASDGVAIKNFGEIPLATELRFSPDGLRLAVAMKHDPLRVYDMVTGLFQTAAPQLKGGSVYWSDDGKNLIYGHRSGQVTILDAETLQPMFETKVPDASIVFARKVVSGRVVLRDSKGVIRVLEQKQVEVKNE